ncbi:CLUMA_CG013274, isoform B [Clunio marinus]|uniref:Coronin n=1 Tax=Clunio marinus TaxID=568069 RepID=A0A1J1IIA3_9DIPT|nr:CLUMA_CG013274, isoform B [Clunio marinus]
MAWRFKASKYKNSTPIVPKPELCIRDIVVGSYQTFGNNIAASASFMAFPWEHTGSSIAVLPIDDCGRKSKTMPLLHAHTDTVTDLEFSPFHDGLLATASQDCLVKIWHIPENGLKESLLDAECSFSHRQKRVETVGFHPTADCLLHSTSAGTIVLYDLTAEKEIFCNNEHPDIIQSLSWKQDGTLLATNSKDKKVRVVDPRSNIPLVSEANSHQSIKDSRIVWLGMQNRILTTGFDSNRIRQIMIRDIRNFSVPEKTLELDCSTGIFMPLFDSDTNMLFLAGKGDTTISFMEVTDKEPYLVEGIRHSGEQTKGACLLPKRALRVMEGEVNRVLQLTSSSVIPIMYQVPRKTYRDFHSDIFPDTNGFKSELLPKDWFVGKNEALHKISLDPAKREGGEKPIITRLGPKPFSTDSAEISFDKVFAVPVAPSTDVDVVVVEKTTEVELPSYIQQEDELLEKLAQKNETEKNETEKNDEDQNERNEQNDVLQNEDETDKQISSIADRRRLYENRSSSMVEEKTKSQASINVGRRESCKDEEQSKDRNEMKSVHTNGTSTKSNNISKRTSTVFGKVSKFRHLKGTTGHKSTHIENIKNVSRQISGECDGFHANHERVAVPLSGNGGKIAVFELSTPGRLPDGVIPTLVNGSNIMDFQWDPFDNRHLVVACDDGTVKIWEIPEGGLKEPTNTPFKEFNAHSEKIHFLKFHPLAKDVLLTASYDMTIKIWDLNTFEQKQCLKGHTDQIFSFAWSLCGTFGATVCKDGKLRIYDIRKSEYPIREGIGGPIGTRGARITFVLEDEYLVVTGFDKVSERQIYILKVDNLDKAIGMVGLDVSPATLVPFYDDDSSTIFLTGRGDTTIYAYEVTDEAPYFCPLSHHRCSSLHQGLSFLRKNQCDVRNVEFAKCYRLTNNSIEPLSFTVPRIKTELFQDDLFPPTRVTWLQTISAEEWFAGKNKTPLKISLQPEGMDALTSTISPPPASTGISSKPNSFDANYSSIQLSPEHTKAKQEALKKSVSERVQVNYELEQDNMEGVDSNEWDE